MKRDEVTEAFKLRLEIELESRGIKPTPMFPCRRHDDEGYMVGMNIGLDVLTHQYHGDAALADHIVGLADYLGLHNVGFSARMRRGPREYQAEFIEVHGLSVRLLLVPEDALRFDVLFGSRPA